jgi:hypothetical protein
MSEREPLYTDSTNNADNFRIVTPTGREYAEAANEKVKHGAQYWTADEMEILRQVLDEKDARIAELEANRWTPVEGESTGSFEDGGQLIVHAHGFSLYYSGEVWEIRLDNDNMAVCRRQGQEVTG